MRYTKSPTIGNVVASIALVGSEDKVKMIVSASEISVIEDLVRSGCDEVAIREVIERGIAINTLHRNDDKLSFSYR